MNGRRGAAALGGLLLVAATLLVSAAPAQAHAQVVGSTPTDGAGLAVAPRQLRIDLSEAVVPGSTRIVLTNGAGEAVTLGQVQVRGTADLGGLSRIARDGDRTAPTSVLAEVPVLAPDVYHVAWSTLSADDLHKTSGVIVFGVGRDLSGARGGVDDPLPPWAEVVLNWVVLLAAGLGLGALLLAEGAPSVLRRRLLRLGATAAAVGVPAGPAQLAVQAAGQLDVRLLSSGYGLGWLLREAALVTIAGLLLSRLRAGAGRPGAGARGLRAVALLGFAAGAVAMGHVRSGPGGPVAVAADLVHVAAATLWLGAVAALALTALSRTASSPSAGAGSGAPLRPLLARFGAVAGAAAASMAVTGVLLVSSGVRSLDALLMSSYGRVLAAKLVLVVLLTAVAGVTALLARPALAPAGWRRRGPLRDPAPGLVRGVLLAEAGLLAAVAVLGVAVGATRPATGTEWMPRSTAVPLRSAQTQDLVQTLSVSPNLPGRNFVTLDVFETLRPSPGPIQQVLVSADGPAGRHAEMLVTPQRADRWLAATDALESPGTWRFTVRVLRPGLPEVVTRYDWLVLDPGARLAHPVVDSTPWSSLLHRLAVGLAGVLALLLVLAAAALRRRERSDDPAPADHPRPADQPRPAVEQRQRVAIH